MSIADLPWAPDGDFPRPDVRFESGRWLDSDGAAVSGERQEVVPGAEFAVAYVRPYVEEPTSADFDDAVPDLGLVFLDFATEGSVLIVDPDQGSESEHTVTVEWGDGTDAEILGMDEAAAARSWSPDQRTAVEDWLLRMIGRIDDLREHMNVTAERITADITAGRSLSLPRDKEFIPDGAVTTLILEAVPDDDIDQDQIDEHGIEGARALVTCAIGFRSALLEDISGYYAADD